VSGVVGQPYSFTFQLSPGSGSAGSTWSVSSGVFPPGLRLSSNDRSALVYGTPTQAGTFTFFLQVRDAPGPWVCCTEEEFTIVIYDALTIAQGTLPSGNVGAAYGYQLTSGGGTASSWTVASGALPAGMGLSAAGAITGTPTQAASATFTVRASDGTRVATKQFTLNVVEPLVLTVPARTSVKLGRSFVLALGARGGLAPYRWSALALPPGINLNPLTGQLGGRPTSIGTLPLVVTATDALGTAQSVTASVRVVAPLAVVTKRLRGARDGKRYAATLRTRGGGTPVSMRLVGSLPRGLRFDRRTGALRGVPALPAHKPIVKTKRVKTKTGVRTLRRVVRRPSLVRTYTVYLVASDPLGQRVSQKLRLTVRP
jgi:hypothetical protein